tara:strand:+ start:3535 stop:3729 length:195 start_codon:yes stop_codon:yes gene_type:complete
MNKKSIDAALYAAEALAIDVLSAENKTDAFVELLVSLPKGSPRPCANLYPNVNLLLDQIVDSST